MGILSSGIALGGVLGLLLGGRLEGIYGWRVAFMTVGVPGFVLAVLVTPAAGSRPAAPARLTVRSFLRDFGIGALPLVRNLWPLLAGVGDRRRRRPCLARPGLRGRLQGGSRRLQRRRGAGPRAHHLRAGCGGRRHAPATSAVRQRDQRRVRRHRARRPDGAPHAHAGLHLRRRRDDLVRAQRHRRLGADVRLARAGAQRRRGRRAAGQVGAHRGHRGHPVRRDPGRLAPPPLRDRPGHRRGARPPVRRARWRSGSSPSATRRCSRRCSPSPSSASRGTTAR